MSYGIGPSASLAAGPNCALLDFLDPLHGLV